MNYKIVESLGDTKISPDSPFTSSEFPRGDETFVMVEYARIDDDSIEFVTHGQVGPRLDLNTEIQLYIDEEIASEPLTIVGLREQSGRLFLRVIRPQSDSTNLGFNLQSESVMLTTNSNLVPARKRIRAHYSDRDIVVYQAFSPQIADSAVTHQKFVDGFDFDRGYTWIKPSFSWMMHRVHWLTDMPEQRILRIILDRQFFLELLENATLTQMPKSGIMTEKEYRRSLLTRKHRVQWDPERNLLAHKRWDWRAIQVGINKYGFHKYNKNIRAITDITDEAKLIRPLMEAKRSIAHLVLPEYPFPTPDQLRRQLDMEETDRIY